MRTSILVNKVGNKIVSNAISSAFFGMFTGEVRPKSNNVLAKGKWIIFDNK